MSARAELIAEATALRERAENGEFGSVAVDSHNNCTLAAAFVVACRGVAEYPDWSGWPLEQRRATVHRMRAIANAYTRQGGEGAAALARAFIAEGER